MRGFAPAADRRLACIVRRHVQVVAAMRLFLLPAFAILLLPGGCSERQNAHQSVDLGAAEKFIDAFYSFNKERLESSLSSAKESQPSIIYYQGWAAGGHYAIVRRMPCLQDGVSSASCSIAVKDDLMGALGLAFDVTDTFHLTFSDGRISSVRTSSNDLKVFDDAEKWVWRERPELVREPCKGYFDGGPTPELCVQAMVRGYAEFAASNEFPDHPLRAREK
jgi:hypothetical protein